MNEFFAWAGAFWMITIGSIFLFSFGYGAASAVSNKVTSYYEARDPNWNKRGFIGCVDGHLRVENIDIKNLHVPEGEFVINLKSEFCDANR